MNILLVCTDFNRSGAALALIELAEKIKETGNNVLILFPGSGEAVNEAENRNIDYKVIRSHEWIKPIDKKESIFKKCKWFLKRIYNIIPTRQISRLIEEKNIDIVHINTLWGYVGALAAKRTNTPYVWHMRELLEEQQQATMRYKKFARSLISDSNAYIVISQVVMNKYKKEFDVNKIHLIYDGVDIQQMYREKHDLFTEDKIKIMTAGGIRESKRQLDVVQAVEILYKKNYNVELKIVGDDSNEYADTVKEYIHNNNLDNFITLTGESSDVASLWEKSDISVTASQFEAFGRVTAEAMLTGCVVVVSNSGANEEIVTDGQTGYVYTLMDPESLACVLEKIINNKEEAKLCAYNGKQSIIDRFSSEKNAAQVVELYKTVLENNKKR